MRVLIVSKTKMGEVICVSGLSQMEKRSLRLLNAMGEQPTLSDRYSIGQLWEMDYTHAPTCEAPHTEDVLVRQKVLVGQLSTDELRRVLLHYRDALHTVEGSIELLYEGKLVLPERADESAYIVAGYVPGYSTAFWCADVPLEMVFGKKERAYYHYRAGILDIKIPFVGFAEPITMIPRHTLVRVSLARWFDQYGKTEPRCYLQLSGWY
jgi:hypothetical protein